MADDTSMPITDTAGKWSWGITGSHNTFDESVFAQGIEDSATGFGFELDYEKSGWYTTVSAEYLAYDDNLTFRQKVIGTGWANKGDSSTKSSNASGLLMGMASGVVRYYGESNDIGLYAQGGINIMARSERTIEACSNCSSQDIDIDGGLFIKTGVKKKFGRMNIGLHAKYYLSGDSLNSTLALSIGSDF